MKKHLFALILALGVGLGVNVDQTQAQNSLTIRVEVPFAFTANRKTLPAGTYRITPVSDNRSVWRIHGENPGEFISVNALTTVGRSGDLHVTFHRYGEQHFLAGFKTPLYEVDLPASRAERALRAPATTIAIGGAASSKEKMSH
jgi:hypothetical protein